MKTSTAARLLAVAVIVGGGWMLYRKASGAVSSLADDIASLPGRALDAITGAAQSVVDGTSIISDPDAGGFVKESPAAGRMPDWKNVRNVDPLIAYFARYGNTATTRASAQRGGWSQDEIGLAVAAALQNSGNL